MIINIAQDVGNSHSADRPGEKRIMPETAVESEGKLVKVALQLLFPPSHDRFSAETLSHWKSRCVLSVKYCCSCQKPSNDGHIPHVAQHGRIRGYHCGSRC